MSKQREGVSTFPGTAAGTYLLPDQLTANEYRPGQGIGPHVDTHAGFQDGVVSLSLGSDIVMEFSRSAQNPIPSQAALSAGAPEGAAGATPDPRNDSSSGSSGERLAPTAQREKVYVLLPRRSLLVLRGEARFAWTHGIQSRKLDVIDGLVRPRGTRVSITLRRARAADDPCRCNWPTACFSQAGGPSRPSLLYSPRLQKAAAIKDGIAPSNSGVTDGNGSILAPNASAPSIDARGASKLSHLNHSATEEPQGVAPPVAVPDVESRHVHALYDTIAQHFSHTRYAPWPRVEAFVGSLPPGAVVYDVGCGNGKYMGLRKDLLAVGCDRSPPLAEICGQRGFNGTVGDALSVPFRQDVADAALSIAVLHHISTLARRVTLLEQLLRCVTPDGGRIFVQAWAVEQGPDSRRDFSAGQDALVPWCLARRFVTGTDEEVAAAGGVIDAKRNVVVFQRFVHAYRRGELEDLLAVAAQRLGATLVDARPESERGDVPLTGEAAGALVEPATGDSGAPVTTGTGSAPAATTVRLLSSWWDKDNWCIVAARG